MHYDSLEQFLTLAEPDLVPLMEDAARAVGGYYAGLSPAALHEVAVHDTHWMLHELRHQSMDRQTMQSHVQEWKTGDVPLAEMTRKAGEMEERLLDYLEAHLAEQPDIYAELVRRIQQMGPQYRSAMGTSHIDSILRRLTQL